MRISIRLAYLGQRSAMRFTSPSAAPLGAVLPRAMAVNQAGHPLILDRGGMRRTWLRGRENIHKRYLIHVAGYNLGLIMRLLAGAGTPRELHARASAYLLGLITSDAALIVIIVIAHQRQFAVAVISLQADPSD